MKISALNESYKPAARKANVAFGSANTVMTDATKKIVEEAANVAKEVKLGGLVDFLEGIKNHGEIANTLTTALGTAFVAPIFIAFNPFSKEDKDTKTYSAMRQPISAVITVVFQVLVNNKFNHWIERMASTANESKNGFFKKIDLSRKPNDAFLKADVKYNHPSYNDKQIRDEVKKRQDDTLYKSINTERERLVNKKLTELSDKDLEYFDYEKMVGTDEYKAAHEEIELEVKQKLKNEGQELSKKQLRKAIKAAATPEKLKERAVKIVERRVIAETENKLDLAKKIKPENKDQIIADTEQRKSDLKKLVEKAKAKGDPAVVELKERFDIAEKQIDKLEKYGIEASKKYSDKTFEEALKMVKIKKSITSSVKFAEGRLSAIKSWGGILVAMATLPFSCGLLNWAYPRIMEKFMPEVSKSKKTKEAK